MIPPFNAWVGVGVGGRYVHFLDFEATLIEFTIPETTAGTGR